MKSSYRTVAMASEYKLHKPYALAALPRPLDHTGGRIVAREVYGQRQGQNKKKRTELVVGVDGEITSIYDVCNSCCDAAERKTNANSEADFHI